MKPFFITSTGTGIGKTLTTCSLCWQLRQQGKTLAALKPVISGYQPHDPDNDLAKILASCGITPTPERVETISPWRYQAPLAPNMAAAKEGHSVDFTTLVQFCRNHALLKSDYTIVEGVGGVMAPLNDTHTVLDWMIALNWPVILVTGSYLGTISHTLTAAQLLKAHGLSLRGIIMCESANSMVDLTDTEATLQKFLPEGTELVKIPRMAAQDEAWKYTPSISWLCE